MSFFRWINNRPGTRAWEPQERLSRAHVAVIGAGGGGSTAAVALGLSGVGTLSIYDDDTVELSNLTRQFPYAEADLGAPKAERLAAFLEARNSGTDVRHHRRRIEGVDDFLNIAGQGVDLMIMSADEPAGIRYELDDTAHRTGVPWVFCGYNGPLLSYGLFDPARPGCYRCFTQAKDDLRSSMGVPSADIDQQRAISPGTYAGSATIVGNLTAHVALCHLTGTLRLTSNGIGTLNLVTLTDMDFTACAPREGCTTCEKSGASQ